MHVFARFCTFLHVFARFLHVFAHCIYLRYTKHLLKSMKVSWPCLAGDRALLPPVWQGTGHFYLMSLFNQILSTEFFSKISKLFRRWKLRLFGLFWHPAQLIMSYKSCPLVALKMSIFLAFQSHAWQGQCDENFDPQYMMSQFWFSTGLMFFDQLKINCRRLKLSSHTGVLWKAGRILNGLGLSTSLVFNFFGVK